MIETNEAGQWRPKKNRLTNTLSLTALIISALTTFLLVREKRRMDIILHYLDNANSAQVKAYNDTFAKAHTLYYIGRDGRYKLWTDSEIADIRAQAIPWQTYPDSEIVARARALDSESLEDGVRYRYHSGLIFASKPNSSWPWLIFDSSAYKASKWFGKMDNPYSAQWLQRGELIPDGVTIHNLKNKHK